jgi:tetratricopeptide (TPR) repeat protein
MNYVPQFTIRLITTMLLVAVFAGAGTPAAAMSANELFEDGNRLFRDDLYWAALLRYRQASEAGMDTALLHYNTGVAHYKAGQHNRARESLEKAARSPKLAPLAHFNLGLNAYAAGEPDEALVWFRDARDQQRNERVSELAREAIARIRRQQRQEDPVYREAVRKQKEKETFDLDLFAQVGFGQDDNVFRTPSQPYIDFADPSLPVVVPVVQSGAFLPVELGAKYTINSYPFEGFYASYRASGSYYQDRNLEDADELSHELRIGNEYVRREDDRKREVYSAFRFSQHDETYFDPDDGLPRSINGIDIGDRMNYTRYGPDIRFRQSYRKFALGGVAKAYLYDFETVEVVPSYDNEYFLLGMHAQYKFTRTSLFRVTVEKFSRRYSDRPSFDLDGSQPIGNPALRYDFLGVSLLARQRLTDSMWFGFEYERVDREDRHVGYHDYVRDHYELEYHWSIGARFDFELSGYYRNYKYDNAFAFNNPQLPRKTLESVRFDTALSYRMTPDLRLVLDVRYDEFASNDTRIEYDRMRYSLGVLWEFDQE